MNANKANSFKVGAMAISRRIRVNTQSKQIEIMECEHPAMDSKVSKTFPLFGRETDNWREKNIETLKSVHQITDGGRGREVDPVVLNGWKAIGLADNSTIVNLDGSAC